MALCHVDTKRLHTYSKWGAYTQAEIGEKLGWSRSKVKQYVAILDKVGTEILEMARGHQEGRVPEDGTTVPTHNFTEGWFRNSGIYGLNKEFQRELMEWFCEQRFWKSPVATNRGVYQKMIQLYQRQ